MAYADRAKPIIEPQLLYVGIRLATLVEYVFLNDAPPPAFGIANEKGIDMPASAQPAKPLTKGAISPDDAAKHIGGEVTVCGRVYSGKYLNRSANGGKNICVKGTVKEYKGQG